jgi:hypothetical protein
MDIALLEWWIEISLVLCMLLLLLALMLGYLDDQRRRGAHQRRHATYQRPGRSVRAQLSHPSPRRHTA